MTTTIAFLHDAYDELLAHARDGTPEEVCGVLAGERDAVSAATDRTRDDDEPDAERNGHGPVNRVRSVHRATNVARSPRRTYLIDPEEQLAIMDGIEEREHEVVGFYHSHPTGPPHPSPTDEARATWAGYSYAICLPGIPFVGSWRWSGEKFVPEVVSVR